MASSLLKPSRIVAVALVVGAVAWVFSGHIVPHAEEKPAIAKDAGSTVPRQKVGVDLVTPEQFDRRIVTSGVTQADRRAYAVARGGGLLATLNVARGATVRAGDVLATLTDEGRSAAVAQAETLLAQREAELAANSKLIASGDLPRNQRQALESAVAAARAALSTARAEAEKAVIKAPIDGVVDSVPVQLGQAIQQGTQIAEVIGPDPMLAVGSVTEKERGEIRGGDKALVRFSDGSIAEGTVSFVSLTADKGTRTYRVEARMANPDARIADGVSCEVAIALAPIDAVRLPLSALVFSDDGKLGVRVVDEASIARFKPVQLVSDARGVVWVRGIDGPARVITLGQEFVKEGDMVEAVSSSELDSRQGPAA